MAIKASDLRSRPRDERPLIRSKELACISASLPQELGAEGGRVFKVETCVIATSRPIE